MNHTRGYRSAARGHRWQCGGQVAAGIWSSSSTGVENARSIIQRSGVSRSALPFYLIDHGRSWEQIFPSEGKDYMVVVDYYSRWLEIVRPHSTTAAVVISKLQHVFSTHGIPDTVISDYIF